MRHRTRILLATTLLLIACGLSKERQLAVHRWLLCEECVAGELDSVIAIGNGAVSALDDALRGPPHDRYENVRRQVLAAYDRLVASGAAVQTSRNAYVDHFLSNYVATYESRAAVALDTIGTPDATNALRRAHQRDSVAGETLYRADVRRVINVGLGFSSGLAFLSQPTNTTVGSAITPAIAVVARDANGNKMFGFTGNVQIAIGTNPAGGVLAGTTTVAAVAGIAIFSNLSINAVGNGYTLSASATGLATATSLPFNITP